MISLPTASQDTVKVADARRTVSAVGSIRPAVDAHHERPATILSKQRQQAEVVHRAPQPDSKSASSDFSNESLIIRLSVRALELLKEVNANYKSSDDPNAQPQVQEAQVEKRSALALSDSRNVVFPLAVPRWPLKRDPIEPADTSSALSKAAEQESARIKSFGTSLRYEQRNIAANPDVPNTLLQSLSTYVLQEKDYSLNAEIGRASDAAHARNEENWWVSHMRITLPSLGTVDINITLRNDAVAMSITSSPESFEHLFAAATELTAALTEKGFPNPRLGVYARD
jgi:hypothetical protein